MMKMHLTKGATADERRQYERQRKRRYRAELRSEQERLEVQVARLQELLQTHLGRPDVVVPRRFQHQSKEKHRELTQSATQNRSLRDQVNRHRDLLRRLHTWVTASVQPSLDDNYPHLHSTLLADPAARPYGLRWLTDRVFHAARATHGFDGSVDDKIRLDIRLDTDGEIRGMENHDQHTVLANFRTVADAAWALDMEQATQSTRCKSILVQEDVCYARVLYARLGTSFCTLSRRYDTSDFAVIVYVFVRDDECFPLQEGELRPHGFSWAIFQKITDDVTLSRCATVQYAPVTTDGVISFEKQAAIFGVEPHPSREVVLARIESTALRNFKAHHDDELKRLNAKIDQLVIKQEVDRTIVDAPIKVEELFML
ncbi:Aste57867_16459 [Aphanomyces stellatus]|uniref:Aste57867_16459 protein n=1 Tax=Aphanomyces stellatus TaxID=120398 RepID=A0A485L5P7_9STRA|nr:hypothetical protein As57867_016402 [Aphanomyces stellatus]VFT93233.1 Aste57867_16459 [Aphanomyces stellatus]